MTSCCNDDTRIVPAGISLHRGTRISTIIAFSLLMAARHVTPRQSTANPVRDERNLALLPIYLAYSG
jgi:hypothetical protein